MILPRAKRQKTGALQDASRLPGVSEPRTSVLDCGGMTPLPLDATCRVVSKRGHVRALQTEFTTADVYTFTRELEKLHPDNSDKHREQAVT